MQKLDVWKKKLMSKLAIKFEMIIAGRDEMIMLWKTILKWQHKRGCKKSE